MKPNELSPGTILGGDFCIERKLTEGGMGTGRWGGGAFLDGPTQSTRATFRRRVGYVGRTIGFRCAR